MVPENIPPLRMVFYFDPHYPSRNFILASSFPLKILAFEDSLTLRNFQWPSIRWIWVIFFNYTMKIRLSLVKMQGFFFWWAINPIHATNIISCLFFCRSPKDGKKGLYVAENVLQFPVTAVGKRSEAKVKICNGSGDTQYLVINHLLPQWLPFLKSFTGWVT